jgi:hypothetical protein
MTGLGLGSETAVFALGAVHGLNPGMGWLFAVALGLQERDRRALWRALPPLALGHAAAIAIALGVATAVGRVLPVEQLRWLVAGMLVTLGAVKLVRHSHPRGGMRIGARDLALWSLLVATAHGAGLMVLPFVLQAPEQAAHLAHAGHGGMHLAGAVLLPEWSATLLHSAGYLAVTMLAAVVVYEKLGVSVLRKAWVNLDLVWAVALIGTGALTAIL